MAQVDIKWLKLTEIYQFFNYASFVEYFSKNWVQAHEKHGLIFNNIMLNLFSTLWSIKEYFFNHLVFLTLIKKWKRGPWLLHKRRPKATKRCSRGPMSPQRVIQRRIEMNGNTNHHDPGVYISPRNEYFFTYSKNSSVQESRKAWYLWSVFGKPY